MVGTDTDVGESGVECYLYIGAARADAFVQQNRNNNHDG